MSRAVGFADAIKRRKASTDAEKYAACRDYGRFPLDLPDLDILTKSGEDLEENAWKY